MADPRPAGIRAGRAVCTVFTANGIVAGAWSVFIPVLIAQLRINEAVMGLLILAGSAGGFTVLVFAGKLIQRFGSAAVTIAGGMALAPALLFLMLAMQFTTAIILFIYLFVAMSLMDVAMNANGAAVEHRTGRAMMSTFHGFWSLGAAVGAFSGGALLKWGGPALLAWFAAAAIAGLTLAAAPRLADRTWEAADKPDDLPAAGWTPPRMIAVYLIGLMAFAAFTAEGSVIDWSAVYLREELSSGIARSGFGLAAFSAAMMAGRFSGDAMRQRFGGRRVLVGSAVLAMAGFALSGLAGSLGVAMAGFALAGLGCANIVPVAFAAAAALPGLRPGTGIAIATMFGYSGLLAGPASFGAAGHAFGFSYVYLFFAVAMFGVILLSPLAAARRPGTVA